MSGGADSLALALLAAEWAAGRDGALLALVVDHGLRPDSAGEAAVTLGRLAGMGIATRLLTLRLRAESRLAERAREARHAVLETTCAEAGILHLLFGHHAADQAETVAMRRLRGSGPAGLAGMAALRETDRVRILRPLLDVPPIWLRQVLVAAGVDWVEDPSNADPASERARLRAFSRDRDGRGPLIRAAVEAAEARGLDRAATERATAAWLGRHVAIFPSGYARIHTATAIPASALAALVATIGGATRPPPPRQVAGWLAAPRPATLGGVQILRRGDGWMLVREVAAIDRTVAPVAGLRWDGRFIPAVAPPDPDADLPAVVRLTLPQMCGRRLRAADGSAMLRFRFAPNTSLAQASFVTSGSGMQKPTARPILGG